MSEIAWAPKTRLGKLVAEGKIKRIEEAIASTLPLKESEIVDHLLPDLMDEVLDITMVQRMTDSGRRVKFRALVVVGNQNGFIGIGEAKDAQVVNAIKKALGNAKVNIIKIRRGCGSWECGCEVEHSVPYEVMGASGSVRIWLVPAPRGLGLVAGEAAKKVLRLAGIKDVWTRTKGSTRTTMNFAKATYDALRQTTMVR
jgi:small subunit ribosomal protein S5